MIANRRFKVLVSGTLALAVLAGAPWTVSAQGGAATSPGPKWEEAQQGPNAEGDQEQAREQIRERIQERIRTAPDLTSDERAAMQGNLEACLKSGAASASLQGVFPGDSKGKQISTQTMLQLQNRVRAAAEEGLPVEAILAKVREALAKGVPDPQLQQVSARIEAHLREAKRIMTQARVDGITPAPGPQRERQMIRELAQQMWRGTTPADVDQLRAVARERSRHHACTLQDLVAASETATRLREEGVEARRAQRVIGEALRQGYDAEKMRGLQFMMMYRHREGRAVTGLVDDFEHCLSAGMGSAHMYQYMMQHGWMGPGDVQGPGGSRPIDDQGRRPGTPGGGPGGRSPGDDPGGAGSGPGGTGSGGGAGAGSGSGGSGQGGTR